MDKYYLLEKSPGGWKRVSVALDLKVVKDLKNQHGKHSSSKVKYKKETPNSPKYGDYEN